MGQYYRPVLEQDNKITVYNRDVDGKYTMAKLCEHSWWENPLMSAISEKLYMKKGRLLWCGDYAEDIEILLPTGLKVSDIWDCDGEEVNYSNFRIDGLFLCNHDKKQFISMEEYFKNSVDDDGWCLHPLSLLTAVGNQRGGGDYYGIDNDYVGNWFWDLISFEPKQPEDYEKITVTFKDV